MRVFRLAIATLAFVFVSSAHAGPYVEPFVTYTQGNGEYTQKPEFGGSTDKFTNTGIGYGAEAGYMFPNTLRLAFDYEIASTDVKYETAGTTRKQATSQYYGIVGYNWPGDVVGYLGLGGATTSDDQTPKTTMTGFTAKIGGGKQLWNFVQANVEVVGWFWNESTTEGSATLKIPDYYSNFTSTAIKASIRIPIGSGTKKK